jgi:hypothetical protein
VQVAREVLERRLLLRRRSASGRQHVARDDRNLAAVARLGHGVPQRRGGEREYREAREDREVDSQVEPAHQVCCLAKT